MVDADKYSLYFDFQTLGIAIHEVVEVIAKNSGVLGIPTKYSITEFDNLIKKRNVMIYGKQIEIDTEAICHRLNL